MLHPTQALAALILERFGPRILTSKVEVGEVTIEVAAADLLDVAVTLRDDPDFAFEQLMDVCGVDYSVFGQVDWETSEVASSTGFSRAVGLQDAQLTKSDAGADLCAVYHLLSITNNQRLRVRVPAVGEPPRVPSVVDVWAGANWFEREAFDLFGILFEGHPDLRRLLSDYGFIGHPFRKDFPLIGHVEMRYDLEKQRVVYEPVSIQPRTLVPRVIRHDHRYEDATQGEDGNDA